MRERRAVLILAGLLTGCTGSGTPTASDAPTPTGSPTATDAPATVPPIEDDGYARCPPETALGTLVVALDQDFSTIGGVFTEAVPPYLRFGSAASHGDCTLWAPPDLFCDPACTGGQTCDLDGTCIDIPGNLDAGVLTLGGLAASVTLEPIQPIRIYSYTSDLPHPVFGPGDTVEMRTDHPEGPVGWVAHGFDPLATAMTEVPLDPHVDTILSWTAGLEPAARVHVQVDVANHGGIPARIECVTADDGELALPATLVEALLPYGVSGFPTVTLTRESSDAVDAFGGCTALATRSTVVLPALIDGVTSCSHPDDCPPDQTCRGDLTCGPEAR